MAYQAIRNGLANQNLTPATADDEADAREMLAERKEVTSPIPSTKTSFTPPELAELWGVSPDKVRAWIHSGELQAVNQAAKQGGRPRYRISRKAIEKFEARRSVQQEVARPRKRRKPADDVTEYF